MADKDELDYDSLEARLTGPESELSAPQEVRSGVDAVRFGREFLLREYGSDEAIAAAMGRRHD